ncbi:hypothetical protein [Helicobacter suis]|uniref:RecJ OB domain-containing protein n=1 Tax=Helicobacter suis TaxID=104628 RepID=A0A6J4CXC4_9HELI|nr:hypothetical protein [Helicobacter suis]BCD45436.1 hypothetical protein NHP190020_04750 [Helicobacter suis]BCD47132.1 hypothetical protein NHP194003_03360 [Helicobacter suis]BCD48887.1 hypothetical protein NHP194004_03340 [Helicobacter suis]BCD50671.1 hypothetical protein NHP194022_03420 [Helicobacter suis]BCD70189.1 hypothetical protein SNTW_08340 [Helicobacter suis]
MLFKVPQLAIFEDSEFLALYQEGEPYGVGNPVPLFEVCARLKSWRYLGQDQKHISFILEDTSGVLLCKWWFYAKELSLKNGEELCVVGEYDTLEKALKCVRF